MGAAEDGIDNAPMAFVLVTIAGLCTCFGAAIVFSRRLVKLTSKRFLAGALGLAAGVMLYVSLVEIFVKSQIAFADSGMTEADSYLYATLCFFGGILFYKGIDLVVHFLDGSAGEHNVDISLYDLDEVSSGNRSPVTRSGNPSKELGKAVPHHHSQSQFPPHHDVVVELENSTGITPSPDLHNLHLRMAGKVQNNPQSPAATMTPVDFHKANLQENKEESPIREAGDQQQPDGKHVGDGDERLVRMGVMTALAIGIHNFPEGLATFVAALSNPSVGIALAVAIAIHNIPEGLCVAIPVYYATGSRWKAFGWALLSGISEPIGAGLGWLVLKDTITDEVYGILFGVVAGMMVNICIHELIPTAVRYDPTDKVTTNAIIVGMAVMALSLTLFLY
ncbi:unnamed protein product [Discosporangium mesarthrocarpum]